MIASERIKTRVLTWLCAVLLVLALAVLTGCNNGAQEPASGDDNPDPITTGTETVGDSGTADSGQEDEFCCHDDFEDFDMVVATVNGIDITAGEVVDYFGWTVDMLVWEYVAMFPDDTEFNFDRNFRDDLTFGRVVLEYSARMAAHLRLYYGFAAANDLGWDMQGPMHPADNVIFTILEDPDLFAPFEQYMQEDDFHIFLEKAEELLERALAGEDFDELVATYSDDGMPPEGYTFVAGDMVPEFESATLELEIGEISGLVITDFGIHIIKRIEPDPENIFMGSRAAPDTPVEDLLGAKHILVMASQSSDEDRMVAAVLAGFENKLETADIVFLDTLDEIPLG